MNTKQDRISDTLTPPTTLIRGASSLSSPDKPVLSLSKRGRLGGVESHGRILLPIARAAISRALDVSRAADETAPWLAEHGACFVTLTQDGELRGCIGTLEAHRPLLADVKSNAVYAALHDPRFMPLSVEELDITTVEISLLSPTTSMDVRDEADALAQMRPNVDGIVFEYGRYRSTFLPQVWEDLAQPRQFLAMLRRKAGLPDDFWEEGVKLSRYTVTKWSEER
ncbi:MAG: AmmeMemoRadiSam system protein A [Gallionella sp.]|nr:AmmeMemoRadiSam system protein A [Gallionella sp.]